jgi:DNA polymerase I
VPKDKDELEQFEEQEEEEVEESSEEYIQESAITAETPTNTPPSILIDVTYDGKAGKALLKLYDFINDRIYYWYDNTGHRPYLITDIPPEEVASKYRAVFRVKGFDHMDVVSKFDPLEMRQKTYTIIYAKDPLSIGGGRESIRDLLPRSWEARIKYHLSYIYDNGLIPGMFYRVENGKLTRVGVEVPGDIRKLGEELYAGDDEYLGAFREWLPLFQAPVPPLKRVAVDIEVYTPQENKIPNPREAMYEIIAIGLAGSDGLKRVLLLRRPGMEMNPDEVGMLLSSDVELMFFDSERDLLKEFFKEIMAYPILVTFNGDSFDLTYIYNRALKLGFRKEELPIVLTRDGEARYVLGVHIDLYKFFSIRAVEVYAFGGKYSGGEKTLDAIASALLGISKVEREKPIGELSYIELANYNFRDALLTLYLTTFNNELTMKLIVLLARISKTPLNDVSRYQVSAWIRNMVYFEHRRRGWLIPNKEDVINAKGGVTTKALIKNKKYAGAIVIEPVAGIYPSVYVLDFASLYPSIIKRWNLSYETVRCPDEKQANDPGNKPVPNLPHWVCTNMRGLTSLLVGLLRDMRVYVYKRLAKSEKDPQQKDYYNVVQAALKVFINASYGVFGAEIFPLYCPPLAELVTALGRLAITKTIVKALDLGLTPIYGDTDSLFLYNPDMGKLEELVNWVKEELGIDIELDKAYRILALSGRKKNYAGILQDGSVDMKGLVGKKRNTPDIAKEAVKDVIHLFSTIGGIGDVEKVTEAIKDRVKEYYLMIRNKDVPLDKLAIKMAVNKPISDYTKNTPQHVKAAELLSKYGVKVGPGDIIFFVKTSTKEGVKPVQLARIDEIDVDKYVEYLRTSLEQILDALGISFENIVGSRLM